MSAWQKLTVWTVLGATAWAIMVGVLVGIVLPAWAGLLR